MTRYMNSEEALKVMMCDYRVTDGKYIYYRVEKLPFPWSGWSNVIIQAEDEYHPIGVTRTDEWVKAKDGETFRKWKRPMTSGDAMVAMENGYSVEDLNGVVYTSGDVTLSNGDTFTGVFQKRKDLDYEYVGLLDDFGCDPLCGEYCIFDEPEEE